MSTVKYGVSSNSSIVRPRDEPQILTLPFQSPSVSLSEALSFPSHLLGVGPDAFSGTMYQIFLKLKNATPLPILSESRNRGTYFILFYIFCTNRITQRENLV